MTMLTEVSWEDGGQEGKFVMMIRRRRRTTRTSKRKPHKPKVLKPLSFVPGMWTPRSQQPGRSWLLALAGHAEAAFETGL